MRKGERRKTGKMKHRRDKKKEKKKEKSSRQRK